MRYYRGKVMEHNGSDLVVDMCRKSCDTCPNQPTCQILGPWREDLIGAGPLEPGTELVLWYPRGWKARYLLLMYGWYLAPLLLLLALSLSLLSSPWPFFLLVIPTLYGAFRLQSRFFGSRTCRRLLQMSFRVAGPGEREGSR